MRQIIISVKTGSPHTDVTIRDNYLSQENSDYACNTIYLTSVQGAVVEEISPGSRYVRHRNVLCGRCDRTAE